MKSRATRRTFDAHEYHRMEEAGISGEDDRIEAIEGDLRVISPTGNRHAACVNRIARLLYALDGSKYIIAVQNPVRLGDLSEPEPDVAVLKYREDFYAESHPAPDDILLVIEVPDTSLEYDRTVKLPLYAKHRIPEVWLVALEESHIEAYTEPQGGRYTALTTKRAGEAVESVAVAGLSVVVGDVAG